MREYLFRGKRIDNVEWVYGDLTRYSESMSYITVDLIENEVYQVTSETVGQFTGLYDKNGRKIFENDIIEISGTYKPGRYVVIWDDYRVAWWGKNLKVRDREYDDDFFQLLGSWQKDITEVIGNAFETVL